MRSPNILPLGLFLAAVCVVPASTHTLVAELDYGTFSGAYDAEYNISYWQKIPFAAPPVGQNRFRAPQPPEPIAGDGSYNSTEAFDMCPQREVNGTEDCLYLGLYGRPWTAGQQLRPVVVTFHGGGYIQGAASFTSWPPSAYPILNVSDAGGDGMMFVYANYRLNAFGFLPGREVAEDPLSEPNAGLLDQRAVLRWTRKYIKKFGGDPDRVTIFGQSAGGGSVLALVSASSPPNNTSSSLLSSHEPPLFSQALASSPFWSRTYENESPEAQWRYDTLANLTGCTEADVTDTLACLKTVDVSVIRDASLRIVGTHKYTTSTFEWGPVIDGVFLREPLSVVSAATRNSLTVVGQPSSALRSGFSMYNTHEGEDFVPGDLADLDSDNSTAAFDEWLAGYLPQFSPADLTQLKKDQYPPHGSTETLTLYNDSLTRAGLVYRDSVLTCPGYWMAAQAAAAGDYKVSGSDISGRGFLGEYTIPPADHAADVYWWNSVDEAQVADPLHYKGFAGAFASFFMTGDPNALKLTNEDVPGVPALDTHKEFVVTEDGFETIDISLLQRRCDFWREMAQKVPI